MEAKEIREELLALLNSQGMPNSKITEIMDSLTIKNVQMIDITAKQIVRIRKRIQALEVIAYIGVLWYVGYLFIKWFGY